MALLLAGRKIRGAPCLIASRSSSLELEQHVTDLPLIPQLDQDVPLGVEGLVPGPLEGRLLDGLRRLAGLPFLDLPGLGLVPARAAPSDSAAGPACELGLINSCTNTALRHPIAGMDLLPLLRAHIWNP